MLEKEIQNHTIVKKLVRLPGMVVHDFDSSTWKGERGGSLWAQGLVDSEFQVIQDYVKRSFLRQKPQNNNNNNK